VDDFSQKKGIVFFYPFHSKIELFYQRACSHLFNNDAILLKLSDNLCVTHSAAKKLQDQLLPCKHAFAI
jgi:hypothetical protein